MDTYITAEQIKYADYDKREDKMLPTVTAKRFIDYMAALWASPDNHSVNNDPNLDSTITVFHLGKMPLLSWMLGKDCFGKYDKNQIIHP